MGFLNQLRDPQARKTTIIQFIKFGIVGAVNTLLSVGVAAVAMWLGLSENWAQVAGFVVGIINAFYWNRSHVFHAKEGQKIHVQLIKTFAVYLTTFLIFNLGLLNLEKAIWGTDVATWEGLYRYVFLLVNLVFTVPINFFGIKLWAMKA